MLDLPGWRHWRAGNRSLTVVAGLISIVLLSVTMVRIVVRYQTPGPFTPDRQGYCDFHNGIYYPARAVMAGESPYSDAYAAKYPVARQIPFFSPVILWLHAPLAVLPLRTAEIINAVWQIGLLLLIAIVCAREANLPRRVDWTLWIACGLVASRAGHVTLFNGYFTLELVLATFLAVAWADRRPAWSGVMLMIVSAKPTYILPLGFLMLARGNWRAIGIGAIFSIAAAAISLGGLAYQEGNGDLRRGTTKLVDQISRTQEIHRGMEDESPIHSWTRLDLFAVVSKWTGNEPGDWPHLLAMFAVLAIPMAILWKRRRCLDAERRDDGIAGVTGGLIMTTMLVSLYHQSYDALLLAAPIVGAIGGRKTAWQAVPPFSRWTLIALMGWPLMNYFSTRSFLSRWELSETVVMTITSLNAVSLTLALILLCWSTLPDRSSPQT